MPWPDWDWFSAKTLKKAAGEPDKPAAPSAPAGIDIAKMAQDAADRAKADADKKKKKPVPASIGDIMQGTTK